MNEQSFIPRQIGLKLLVALTIALFLLTISFFLNRQFQKKNPSASRFALVKDFPAVALDAKAAYVYDVKNRTILFARNENVRLPLASLTKIMSALVAVNLSPLYGTVTISQEALRAGGDSGLYKDERWSLQNLLDFSLVTSSNDAMRAVALSLGALSNLKATPDEIINNFVAEMNRKAQELGLEDTYFWNETGLDLPVTSASVGQTGESEEVKGGAYGTVKDLSVLLTYILVHHPELLAATRQTRTTLESLDRHLHIAKNTNSIAAEIPRLLASKTGFTNTAGGNLALVFDPELGRPIIVSILGSTEAGRFEDARTLIRGVMKYIGEE